MKMKYIIGNWKSNKNIKEVEEWFKIFADLYRSRKTKNFINLEIVVCPPYIYLPSAKKIIGELNLPVKLGVQDASPFTNGAYTGEVSADQLKEYVQYVIIGHSERRKYFHEEDKLLAEKVKRVSEAKLNSIFCVQDENTYIPDGVNIVAYEPVWAIGTGKTDTPENANNVAENIKHKWNGDILIYGGSVTAGNINSFINTNYIDGVLPGGASLDPNKFWGMIINAATV